MHLRQDVIEAHTKVLLSGSVLSSGRDRQDNRLDLDTNTSILWQKATYISHSTTRIQITHLKMAPQIAWIGLGNMGRVSDNGI
jgi:hypothetical protein